MTNHNINVTITENSVIATLNYIGKTYQKSLTGNMDFTADAFIPVFKQMGVELLCEALLHKDTFTLIIKYPDINDEYDGFTEGEVKVIKEN